VQGEEPDEVGADGEGKGDAASHSPEIGTSKGGLNIWLTVKRTTGIALLALLVSGCGSSHPGARLLIATGGRVYRLQCDPAGGTAPRPERICAELRRSPNLLVGGPAIDHSCPPAAYTTFRIAGTYRGHRVDAIFPPSSCAWVPGQGDGAGEWTYLMHGAGTGEPESNFASLRVSSSKGGAKLEKLRLEARRLLRKRRAALAAGTLRFRPGAPPDALAIAALRAQGKYASSRGPEITQAFVYSTTAKQ
jgi:hypothetical protein